MHSKVKKKKKVENKSVKQVRRRTSKYENIIILTLPLLFY